MEAQFIFSKFVTGKNFIGRKTETTILSNLLTQGENIVIYDPPKSGKKSLIQNAFLNMRMNGLTFTVTEVSLLDVRSVADVALKIASEAMRTAASTPEEYMDYAGRFLEGTHVVFDPEAYSSHGTILSKSWDLDKEDIKALLRLPYLIAIDRSQKTYVVIEEFQNVMLTEDGELLCSLMEERLKELTAQEKAICTFIFSGSRVNAMKEIFEGRKYFYRLVEHMTLGPIDTRDITDYVTRTFLSNGKVIDRELMFGVCKLFRNNIWYINHFCFICNALSKGYIIEALLRDALAEVISIHEPRFLAIINDLTTFQVQLLRAILDGHTRFSSAEVISRYSLNSSATVRRLKDALCKKEIVTFDDNDNPIILDPLFEYWVKDYYFKIR